MSAYVALRHIAAEQPILQQLACLIHRRVVAHPRAPAVDIVVPTFPASPSYEGTFLQSLHPALVVMRPVTDDGSISRWVARLPAGLSLAERIRTGGPLDALQVATILRQIAPPLDAMHRLGYAHGWLSAELIWLLPDERVLVGGCGLGAFIRQAGLAVSPTEDRRALAELVAQALAGEHDRQTMLPPAVARVVEYTHGPGGFATVEALADALRDAAHRAERAAPIMEVVADAEPAAPTVVLTPHGARRPPLMLPGAVAAVLCAMLLVCSFSLSGVYQSPPVAGGRNLLGSLRETEHAAGIAQAQTALLDGTPRQAMDILAPIAADSPAASALIVESRALFGLPTDDAALRALRAAPASPDRDRALVLGAAARAYATADTGALRAAYADAGALVASLPETTGTTYALTVLARGEIGLLLYERTGERQPALQTLADAQQGMTAGGPHTWAHLLLARAASATGDDALATRTLDAMTASADRAGPIALARGWNALRHGQPDTAAQQFAIASEDPAMAVEAARGAARLAALRNDYAAQAQLLQQASAQAPHRADLADLAGWASRSYGVFLPERSPEQREAFAAAARSFTHALNLNPRYADAHTGLGWVLQDTAPPGSDTAYSASVAAFRMAISLDASQPFAHNGLGWSLLALKRYEEARATFEQALALQPAYNDALYGLGQAQQALGDVAAARATYDRAAALGNADAATARAALP